MLREFQDNNSEIEQSTARISSTIQEILGSLLQVGYELRAQHKQLATTIPEPVSDIMEGSSKQSRKRKRAFFTCSSDADPVSFYWSLIEDYHNR